MITQHVVAGVSSSRNLSMHSNFRQWQVFGMFVFALNNLSSSLFVLLTCLFAHVPCFFHLLTKGDLMMLPYIRICAWKWTDGEFEYDSMFIIQIYLCYQLVSDN